MKRPAARSARSPARVSAQAYDEIRVRRFAHSLHVCTRARQRGTNAKRAKLSPERPRTNFPRCGKQMSLRSQTLFRNRRFVIFSTNIFDTDINLYRYCFLSKNTQNKIIVIRYFGVERKRLINFAIAIHPDRANCDLINDPASKISERQSFETSSKKKFENVPRGVRLARRRLSRLLENASTTPEEFQ